MVVIWRPEFAKNVDLKISHDSTQLTRRLRQIAMTVGVKIGIHEYPIHISLYRETLTCKVVACY